MYHSKQKRVSADMLTLFAQFDKPMTSRLLHSDITGAQYPHGKRVRVSPSGLHADLIHPGVQARDCMRDSVSAYIVGEGRVCALLSHLHGVSGEVFAQSLRLIPKDNSAIFYAESRHILRARPH